MRLALSIALLLALLPLGALAGEPAPRKADTSALVEGNTAFALDLYGRLRAGDGNLFLSPYSISACLGMVRAGAVGETAAEMDRVLHLPADPGSAFRALAGALRAPTAHQGRETIPAYEIQVANRLFGQRGFAFKAPFLTQMQNDFAAGLEQLDIEGNPSGARRHINGWVEKQTAGKIEDLLPEDAPSPDTRLVLVNAIYFKSQWEDPFRERATQDAPFHRADGSQVDSRLMRRVGGYGYGAVEGAQILQMPYRNGAMSMVVVLPRERDGLAALEADLGPEKRAAWLGSIRHQQVSVEFPKVKMTSSFDLTSTLSSMGMPLAFTPLQADFTGMTDEEPLFIGLVVHKAFVAVDEKGTEAAAATAAMMKLGSAAGSSEPVSFRADHPFLFLIRHHKTGSILFMGRVNDPS